MFDIGWPELMILVIVAVVVVGPKDLPRLMATLGRYMARARAMAAEFQKGFEDIARDAELEELKREIDRAGEGDILKTPPPIRPDDDDETKPASRHISPTSSSVSGEPS